MYEGYDDPFEIIDADGRQVATATSFRNAKGAVRQLLTEGHEVLAIRDRNRELKICDVWFDTAGRLFWSSAQQLMAHYEGVR